MLRWYQAKLRSAPIRTQSITTAILFATGDIMAQQGVEKAGLEKHDYVRTARMAGYGGIIFGPLAHTWYTFLASRIGPQASSSSSTKPLLGASLSPHSALLTRVALDQLVFAPLHLPFFLSTMAVLEGESAKERIKKAYKPALLNNWLVWPVVQYGNFRWVPLEGRVLVVNGVSLGWNCYLSYLNSSGGGGGSDGEKKDELPPS